MLDSFILMGPGGRICYMGNRRKAVEYFADLGYVCPTETNPAECKIPKILFEVRSDNVNYEYFFILHTN